MRPVGAELRFMSRAFPSKVCSPGINFKCM